jgi:hypothetical protein
MSGYLIPLGFIGVGAVVLIVGMLFGRLRAKWASLVVVIVIVAVLAATGGLPLLGFGILFLGLWLAPLLIGSAGVAVGLQSAGNLLGTREDDR